MAMVDMPLLVSGIGMLLITLMTALVRKKISFFPINLIFYLSFSACASVFFMLLNFSDDLWKFAHITLLCCIFSLYLSALISY